LIVVFGKRAAKIAEGFGEMAVSASTDGFLNPVRQMRKPGIKE